MKFSRRLVRRFEVILVATGHIVVQHCSSEKKVVTAYAHMDDELGTQLFGIECCNKLTGEVTTQQIQLSAADSHVVLMIEELQVEQ